jgi:hypothetical protein
MSERKYIKMNKIFGFTERSLNFWLSFFSKKKIVLLTFAKLNMAMIGNGHTPNIKEINLFLMT